MGIKKRELSICMPVCQWSWTRVAPRLFRIGRSICGFHNNGFQQKIGMTVVSFTCLFYQHLDSPDISGSTAGDDPTCVWAGWFYSNFGSLQDGVVLTCPTFPISLLTVFLFIYNSSLPNTSSSSSISLRPSVRWSSEAKHGVLERQGYSKI